MSGLFSDLHNGIRMPNVVMNQGPTPSQTMPSGFTTDSQINYGSTLLGDLNPYSYGAPSRLADQTAYMAIPHRIPKIIPELRLPEARNTDNTFLLSHGVDDGDVAFSLRVNRSASTIDVMKFTGYVTGASDPSCVPPCFSEPWAMPNGLATSLTNRSASRTVKSVLALVADPIKSVSTMNCCHLTRSGSFQYRCMPASR
jgi:hypothetical protein